MYSWDSPGGAGLQVVSCPGHGPVWGRRTAARNYFNPASCTFKAVSKTNSWVVFGPMMGLAISQYQDGDYYAVVGGGGRR